MNDTQLWCQFCANVIHDARAFFHIQPAPIKVVCLAIGYVLLYIFYLILGIFLRYGAILAILVLVCHAYALPLTTSLWEQIKILLEN